jgi:hypothetical protein
MRTAPQAAWAAWICNRAIAGGAAARNDWLQSQESGLRPALFVSVLYDPAAFLEADRRVAGSRAASAIGTSGGAAHLVPSAHESYR